MLIYSLAGVGVVLLSALFVIKVSPLQMCSASTHCGEAMSRAVLSDLETMEHSAEKQVDA